MNDFITVENDGRESSAFIEQRQGGKWIESLAVLKHEMPRLHPACSLTEMEHDAVGLVERSDEIAELGTEHAL